MCVLVCLYIAPEEIHKVVTALKKTPFKFPGITYVMT